MKRLTSVVTIALIGSAILISQPNVGSAIEELDSNDKKVEKSKEEKVLFVNKYFSAPELLMVEDVPLNTHAMKKYPSPELYDIDNDGVNELVVGDIFGAINVYENSNVDSADPKWEKFKPLRTSDGEKIKVSNW